MSLSPSERRVLFDQLAEEHELAPPALLASNVAGHFDRPMARLLTCGDPAVLALALARLADETLVRRAEPPYAPLEGGYGKTFGPITVADKARFLLTQLLPEPAARAAIAEGPAWWDRHGRALRWDARARRFTL